MKHLAIKLSLVTLLLFISLELMADTNITRELKSLTVLHNQQPFEITRHPDPQHKIEDAYAKTSRPCPPFCIQPIVIAPGVETYGELEVLAALDAINRGRSDLLLVDSRTPDWFVRGTIPGAINIPWTHMSKNHKHGGEIDLIMEELLGVNFSAANADFTQAKTLVIFCNGPWCGQSRNIAKLLLEAGYPPQKIKWYRGGIQSWRILGLRLAK